jgi:2-polyprenyl-3-methyl-5-hydroxy-6-metoxy-1,4-benzoquinol methylase
MKNSWDLKAALDPELNGIANYDRNEIDALRWFSYVRLHYLDRIETVISIVKRAFPQAKGIKIAEVGCAQANMSLLLAESGYRTFAIDIDPRFLKYSRAKYEKGDVQWIAGDINGLQFSPGFFDVAILGEIVTLWAYPERLLEKVMYLLRPGGLAIVTMPNGSRIRFKHARFPGGGENATRRRLTLRQFGMDHLFKLTPHEFLNLLPQAAEVVDWGYCGSTILVNKYSERIVGLFPEVVVRSAIRMLSHWPVLNRTTYNSLYFVLRKESPEGRQDRTVQNK